MTDLEFDWQEEWEKAAAAEYLYYGSCTNQQLISALKEQAIGSHYRIWDAIRDRGKVQMIRPLMSALKHLSGTAYFHDRHHCVDAILYLAEIKNRALRTRIVGPSNEFNSEQFELALRELEIKLKKKIKMNVSP